MDPKSYILILYFFLLLLYHGGEYILTRIVHGSAGIGSFLFSIPYILAQLFSLLEFSFESSEFPAWKHTAILWLWLPGLLLCASGLLIRFTAMITAGRSFTHLLQNQKRPEHVLITNGIYAWSRHPGYLGWFIWAVSSQLLLSNPVCLLLFAYWSWKYFDIRIKIEEKNLILFFGQEYLNYKRRTPVRIPFIS